MVLHRLACPLTGRRAGRLLTAATLSSPSRSLALLDELAQMVAELRATSRRNEKFVIVKAHPRMHELLCELVHCSPLYLGRRSVAAAAAAAAATAASDSGKKGTPEDDAETVATSPSSSWDVVETMRRLCSRELKGQSAIDHLGALLAKYPQHGELLRELFEKRLRFGMGERLLERALDAAISDEDEPPKVLLPEGALEQARHITPTLPPHKRTPSTPFPVTSKELPVALGFPLQHPSVRLGTTPGVYWLLSRKLDGVRCLARVTKDGHGDGEGSGKPMVTLYSRAGKVLDHLRDIRQEVLELASALYRLYPDLGTFYLDGELCILRSQPRHGSGMAAASTTAIVPPSSLAATGMDDFRAALSIVLSRPTEGLYTDAHRLCFFLFDLIDPVALGQTLLSERLARLETAMGREQQQASSHPPHHRVQLLPQHRTADPLSFRSLLSEHWEGLVIRKDAPHLAKRSRDILKVKDFYEAEFTIVDWRVEPMMVVREGRHVKEPLLAAVKVQLAGNDVWVGSGLTLEERRRYAANPEGLRGAQVTVRYFQESSNQKNDRVRSLRFPTIKAIYQGEGRTV